MTVKKGRFNHHRPKGPQLEGLTIEGGGERPPYFPKLGKELISREKVLLIDHESGLDKEWLYPGGRRRSSRQSGGPNSFKKETH